MKSRLVLALPLLAACSATPTEIVVAVTSDMSTPNPMAAIRLTLTADEDVAGVSDFRFDGEPQTELPFSFVVAPEDEASPPSSITVTLEPKNAARESLFTTRITTSFIDGRRLAVTMNLSQACAERPAACPDGSSCVDGECQMPEVAAANLDEIDEPGDEL